MDDKLIIIPKDIKPNYLLFENLTNWLKSWDTSCLNQPIRIPQN